MSENQYRYAIEKLTTALSVLVSHPGDARERLTDASQNFRTLRDRDFPPHLQNKWQQIMKELTKYGPPLRNHEGAVLRGSVENTMRRIRKKTASEIIKKIYDLYWEISENKQYL